MGKTNHVSRATYQKLAEASKKLVNDIKILVGDIPEDSELVRIKWQKHFKKEADFNRLMREIATDYIKKHPECDINSSKFNPIK